MRIKVLKKVNPCLEILGLLYESLNEDKLLKRTTDKLKECGIYETSTIKRALKLIEKYKKAFKKNQKGSLDRDLFTYITEDDEIVMFILTGITVENYPIKEQFLNKDSEYFKLKVLEFYFKVMGKDVEKISINSLEKAFDFIEGEDISDRCKWNILKLLNNPKKYIVEIFNLIAINIEAFTEAYTLVEDKITREINILDKAIEKDEFSLEPLIGKTNEVVVTPTISFGGSILILENNLFVGAMNATFSFEINKANGDKGNLLLILKALGDKSKLEILNILKASPKYSMELANSLNLTPATISHHMSTLLELGLIKVEKNDGKIYYTINRDRIERFLNLLNKTLL